MKHKTHIGVRFADMDSLGHINNAKYLTYFEQARIQYLDDVLGKNIQWNKYGVILARAETDFLMPVKYQDEIAVYTGSSRFGTKSFDLHYQMIRTEATGDELKEITVATCKTVLVCFDYENQISIAVPELWKKLLKEYDAKK